MRLLNITVPLQICCERQAIIYGYNGIQIIIEKFLESPELAYAFELKQISAQKNNKELLINSEIEALCQVKNKKYAFKLENTKEVINVGITFSRKSFYVL